MFGIEDGWVSAAYLLCILSSILCVIYGAITWNKGDDAEAPEEDKHWGEEEDKLEETL